MSKSKLTLLVDGNWLLMSRLSVLRNKYVDDVELNHQLKLLMIKSINIVLRTFNEIDNIIFVADGGSWRNKIEIPYRAILSTDTIHTLFPEMRIDEVNDTNIKQIIEQLQNDESSLKQIEYKGTRTKSDDFNWDMLFASYEEFMNMLRANGITCCRENGMEGDDWCYHWSKYLNEHGTNVIIWTKDKDLTQLVKMSKDKNFTIWWNKDSGIIASDTPEEEMNWLFNTQYTENDNMFQSLVDKSDKITTVNPNAIVVDKILRGDESDNIMPIIMRRSKSNSDRQFKISPKDIDTTLDYTDDDAVHRYLEHLYANKNYSGRVNKSLDQAFEHFKYNRSLVALNDMYYPRYVKQIMENNIEYNISKDCSGVESQLLAESQGINNILDII